MIPNFGHSSSNWLEKIKSHELYVKIFKPKSKIKMPKIPKIESETKKFSEVKNNSQRNLVKDEKTRKKYDLLFVKELLLAVRNRMSNKDVESQWFNVIDQGGSREGMYRALVLDGLYLEMENQDSWFSIDASTKAQQILSKFINENYDIEGLNKFNVFSLKRMVTEKLLEITDLLLKNEDDFFSWYAFLSVDYSVNKIDVFKNKLRKSKSLEEHYKWAKSVPTQMIKSELIIKTHKLFNSYL